MNLPGSGTLVKMHILIQRLQILHLQPAGGRQSLRSKKVEEMAPAPPLPLGQAASTQVYSVQQTLQLLER